VETEPASRVGRRPRGRFRADLAAGAAAVVDDEGCAEDGGHFRGDDAHDRIVGAAGGVGRDQPNGAVRIGLADCVLRAEREAD